MDSESASASASAEESKRERIVTRSLKRENRYGKIDKNNDWYTFIGGTLALLVLIGGTVFWDPVVNQAADFSDGYSDWCSDWMAVCDGLLPEASQLSNQLLCVYRDQAKGRAHYMFAQDALVGTNATENEAFLAAQFTAMTSNALANVSIGGAGTALLPLVNGLGLYVDCEKDCPQTPHLMDGESFLFLLFRCVITSYAAVYVNPTTYGSQCSLNTSLAASLTVYPGATTAAEELHCRLRVNWLLNAAVMRVHIFQYCSFPIFQGLLVTFGALMLLMLGVNAMILTHRPSSLIVEADKMEEQYKKLGIYEPDPAADAAAADAAAPARRPASPEKTADRYPDQFTLRHFMANKKSTSTWSLWASRSSMSLPALTESLQQLNDEAARNNAAQDATSAAHPSPLRDQRVQDALEILRKQNAFYSRLNGSLFVSYAVVLAFGITGTIQMRYRSCFVDEVLGRETMWIANLCFFLVITIVGAYFFAESGWFIARLASDKYPTFTSAHAHGKQPTSAQASNHTAVRIKSQASV